MNIEVLLSSGEIDEWEDVSDAIEGREGALMIICEIRLIETSLASDEIPVDAKIVKISSEVDNGMDRPPSTKTKTYRVMAIYASGMWMKVEFE